MNRTRLAWMIQPDLTELMLRPADRRLLSALTDVLWWEGDQPPNAEEAREALANADAAVFSWGAPSLTAQVLDGAPHLQRVYYAAGSVKPIVDDALWARGIRLTSAAAAIAENVAEYTVGLIILGLYNHWALSDLIAQGQWERKGGTLGEPRALIDTTVGVLGAGQVGRRVLRLLQNFPCRVLLYDPFVGEDVAQELGATKTSLEELLPQADAVTIHVPNLPETQHLLNRETLALMRDDAVLINTARGGAIDEDALITELRKGRFFALLDVTNPEPPAADHPFRTLPNVRMSPHIAGGVNNGRRHIGRLVLEQIQRDVTGQEPIHVITKEMLPYIA
jgi:phosphoglycerate dehydrogenase-like enzyme